MSGDTKSVLKQIQKKVGHTIQTDSLMKLAGSLTESQLKNPDELRKLIKKVASTANVPVSEGTVKDLVSTIQKQKIGVSQIRSLLKKL